MIALIARTNVFVLVLIVAAMILVFPYTGYVVARSAASFFLSDAHAYIVGVFGIIIAVCALVTIVEILTERRQAFLDRQDAERYRLGKTTTIRVMAKRMGVQVRDVPMARIHPADLRGTPTFDTPVSRVTPADMRGIPVFDAVR